MMSALTNNQAWDSQRTAYKRWMISKGVDENVASYFASSTFSDGNRHREIQDLAQFGGFLPGTQRGYGVDVSFTEALGFGTVTAYDLALKESERTGVSVAEAGAALGFIDPRMEGNDPEEALKANVILSEDDLSRVSESDFEAYATEANKRGIVDPNSRRAFIYAQAQQDAGRIASDVVNGRAKPEELAALFDSLAGVLGADVVHETFLTATQTDFNREAAWRSLPDDVRAGLEFLGVSSETFLADRPDIANDFMYHHIASTTLVSRSGEMGRNLALETGMHNEWSSLTRNVTDMFRADFLNDPTAVYMTAGTVIGGAAAGLKQVGQTTFKKMALYGGLDGFFTGGAEGYMMSMQEQMADFYMGNSSIIFDETAALHDSLQYAAMGSVAGGGLGAAFGAAPHVVPRVFRGGPYAAAFARKTADKIAATGIAGEEAASAARNAIAIREATNVNREAASLVADSLSEGAAIRLHRGEMTAGDVAREIIPKITRQTGMSDELEALLSPESLARAGVSSLEMSDALARVAKRLGPDVQVDEATLGGIMRKYLEKANKTKRLAPGDPLEARAQLVDEALTVKGAEAIRRFTTNGEGTTLSAKQAKRFAKNLQEFNSGKEFKDTQLKKLMKNTISLSDEEAMDEAAKIIRKGLTRLGKTDQLKEFEGVLDKVKKTSAAFRENPEVQKALRVRAALAAINPEKTISLAEGMGATSSSITRYVDKLMGAVGDLKKIDQINQEMASVKAAVDRIDAEGKLAFKFNEGVDSFYRFSDFESEDIMADILEVDRLRKKARSG